MSTVEKKIGNYSFSNLFQQYSNNYTEKFRVLCKKVGTFKHEDYISTKKAIGIGCGILVGLGGVYISSRLSKPELNGAICRTFNPFIREHKVIYQSSNSVIEAKCSGWRLISVDVKNWSINNGNFSGTLDEHGRPIKGTLVTLKNGFTDEEFWYKGKPASAKIQLPEGKKFRGLLNENGKFMGFRSCLVPQLGTSIYLDSVKSSWTSDKMPIGKVKVYIYDQCDSGKKCVCPDGSKGPYKGKEYKGTLNDKLQFSGSGKLYDLCTHTLLQQGCWKEGKLLQDLTYSKQPKKCL